jgi:hypothetical protein
MVWSFAVSEIEIFTWNCNESDEMHSLWATTHRYRPDASFAVKDQKFMSDTFREMWIQLGWVLQTHLWSIIEFINKHMKLREENLQNWVMGLVASTITPCSKNTLRTINRILLVPRFVRTHTHSGLSRTHIAFRTGHTGGARDRTNRIGENGDKSELH